MIENGCTERRTDGCHEMTSYWTVIATSDVVAPNREAVTVVALVRTRVANSPGALLASFDDCPSQRTAE